MKRYGLVAVVLLGGLLLLCAARNLLAQEEEIRYSWGTVSSIAAQQISVTEYDSENDQDVESTYTLEPDVQLSGVEKLAEIEVGDSLEIDYVVKDGKKIIKTLTVEKQTQEELEEDLTLPTYEEELEFPSSEIKY